MQFASIGLLFATLITSVSINAKIDAGDLESFMDGVWYSQKESHPAVGAVVTVVSRDGVLLHKGYGYSDLETQTPVDPDETLFRIASISKTFTWIAVMQLVEQGKLDLDRDVNEYLQAFQIPNTYPEPITMTHLMSHNAGFEDKVLDLGRRSADDLQPLGTYLKNNLPRRVRPVGQHSSYSNHSTAIAAHIVEVIAGKPWSDYIESEILEPLKMQRTSARHPMAPHHKSKLASSYQRRAGAWQKHDFMHWFIYPAGMMSTTGGDMIHYMQSHLNQGQGVLKPETFDQMVSPLHRPFPEANAWLHGYSEGSRNDIDYFGHGGDLNGFHSILRIFPEQDIALFVSVNADPAARIRSNVANALVDRLYPKAPPKRDVPGDDAASSQKDFHGTYGRLRRNFSDFSKLALLMSGVSVGTNRDGYLTISTSNGTRQYVHLEGDRYAARYDHSTIKFIRNQSGDVTHMEFSTSASAAMDKLAWYDKPEMHRLLFGCVAIVLGFYFAYWPIRGLRRRYYNVQSEGLPGWFYIGSWVTAAGVLYALLRLAQGLGNEEQFYFEIPDQIIQLLQLVVILCALIVVHFFTTIILFIRHPSSSWERFNFSLFCLAALSYVGLSYYWNLSTFFFT